MGSPCLGRSLPLTDHLDRRRILPTIYGRLRTTSSPLAALLGILPIYSSYRHPSTLLEPLLVADQPGTVLLCSHCLLPLFLTRGPSYSIRRQSHSFHEPLGLSYVVSAMATLCVLEWQSLFQIWLPSARKSHAIRLHDVPIAGTTASGVTVDSLASVGFSGTGHTSPSYYPLLTTALTAHGSSHYNLFRLH